MTYADESFWDAYGEYLSESAERHAKAFDSLVTHVPGGLEWDVMDFGCGPYASALYHLTDHFSIRSYVGVDKDSPGKRSQADLNSHTVRFVEADYTAPKIPEIFYEDATAFTSLFSTEVAISPEETTNFYTRVFNTYPKVKWGMVAGFFYIDKRHDLWVAEEGNLLSYQSDPDYVEPGDEPYTTITLQVPAPSTLFGQDVVEVWKLMVRK